MSSAQWPRPARTARAPGRARPRDHQLRSASGALSTFSATVEPTVYLLAFGFGFGSLVSSWVGGYDYVEYVGTGTVATAVLFSSAFPAMFGTFVKYKFQRTYDAILAAPVDTEELVTAEALWLSLRAGTYGCAPMLVAMLFGLDPSWGMLLVPPIAMIAGFGWANFGICDSSARVNSIDNFNYITSAVLTPLFLVAGTFFPIDGLPEWAQVDRAAEPALPPGGARPQRRVRVRGGLGRHPPRGVDRLRAVDLAAGHPVDDQAPHRLGAWLPAEAAFRDEPRDDRPRQQRGDRGEWPAAGVPGLADQVGERAARGGEHQCRDRVGRDRQDPAGAGDHREQERGDRDLGQLGAGRERRRREGGRPPTSGHPSPSPGTSSHGRSGSGAPKATATVMQQRGLRSASERVQRREQPRQDLGVAAARRCAGA